MQTKCLSCAATSNQNGSAKGTIVPRKRTPTKKHTEIYNKPLAIAANDSHKYRKDSMNMSFLNQTC